MSVFDFNRDLSNYMLIGGDVYQLTYHQPTKVNMTPIKKSNFIQKFRFSNRDWEELPEFSGFTSEPCHGKDYQREINGQWNTYSRVNWDPKPGKWPTIEKLINHLYGDNGVESDQREELYDYHTLLIKQPKQKLFARILYSIHQGTSKSALGQLESMMFEDNYNKVRDSELESDFNSLWVQSLIIHLDEPSFDKPKQAARKIRDIVTSDLQNLRKMKQDYVKVPFYGKILVTTNDSDFMPIEKTDRRYWIREVPPIPEEDKDPHFIEKMQNEISHYLHFLLTREMKYTQSLDSTFYLPNTVLKTNGLKKLVGDNQDTVQRQIEEFFEGYFLDHSKYDSVKFTSSDLIQRIEWQGKEPSAQKLGIILRDGLGLIAPETTSRLKNGDNYIFPGSDKALNTGRYWTATKLQFNYEPDVFDTKNIK